MPVNLRQLKEMMGRLETKQLTAEDYEVVRQLLATYRQLVKAIKDPNITWDDLSQRFLGEDDRKFLNEEAGKSDAT